MYKHPSKRNTLSNITNIEDLSINYETPESILIAAEEDEENDFTKLLREVAKLKSLTRIDLEVLAGEKTRKQAAEELEIKYNTYKSQLLRKITKIREELK